MSERINFLYSFYAALVLVLITTVATILSSGKIVDEFLSRFLQLYFIFALAVGIVQYWENKLDKEKKELLTLIEDRNESKS